MFGEVGPNRDALIIKSDADGVRRLAIARWGVPPPADVPQLLTTVGNLASPFWRAALDMPARRCLVPASAFRQSTGKPDPATGRKRQLWFDVLGHEVFAFAGVTRWGGAGEPERFALLTCKPNGFFAAAVEAKAMPVILLGEAGDAWLAGAPARSLARTVANMHMRIVA